MDNKKNFLFTLLLMAITIPQFGFSKNTNRQETAAFKHG